MKYLVKVCIGNADAVLALMTLEEANQQFVVRDNCLVKQEVMPMSKEHVLGRLAYELNCVEDAKDFLAMLSENSGSSTYYRNKYMAQLNEHEANITMLNQALSIMENSNV